VSTQPPTPSPARASRPAARTPLVFLAIAGASVAAAGVGGYVAQSQRQAEGTTVEARPAQPARATAAATVPAGASETPTPTHEAPPVTSMSSPVEPSYTVSSAPAEPVQTRTSRATVQPRRAPEPGERRRREPAVPHARSARVAATAPVTQPVAPPQARTAEPAPAVEMPAPDPPAVVEATPPPPIEPAVKPQSAQVSIADTFVIPADSVIGLEIEHSVSSETAQPEDRVDARVARDVKVDGTVVIPAGSRVRGEVTRVENGGRFKERGRIEIRFHTLVLADGDSLTIETDPLFREGENVGRKAGARIGATAAGGAIIGAIFGGEKGAAIGAAAGAGAGTAVTAAQKPSEARFRAGSVVTVRLTSPVSIAVQQ
jgi:hypothetical protein